MVCVYLLPDLFNFFAHQIRIIIILTITLLLPAAYVNSGNSGADLLPKHALISVGSQRLLCGSSSNFN